MTGDAALVRAPEEPSRTFGTALRKARNWTGLTMGCLAQLLDLSLAEMSSIERDKSPALSVTQIFLVVQVLRLTPEVGASLVHLATTAEDAHQLTLAGDDALTITRASMGEDITFVASPEALTVVFEDGRETSWPWDRVGEAG